MSADHVGAMRMERANDGGSLLRNLLDAEQAAGLNRMRRADHRKGLLGSHPSRQMPELVGVFLGRGKTEDRDAIAVGIQHENAIGKRWPGRRFGSMAGDRARQSCDWRLIEEIGFRKLAVAQLERG